MQAVVVARLVFCAEVCVFWFIESGVFHELLFDFDFDFDFDFVCWIDWGRHPPLLALHASHVAGNGIGDEGCTALSSSLVHLSHLKELDLSSECF